MSVILPILTEFNDKGVKSATQSLKNLAKTYATTAIASGVLLEALSKTVKDASNLNESITKTGVIFGNSTDQITAFARTAADTFGQSTQQALDAASTFGIFGKAAGMSGTELVDFSTNLTQLSSDFASFFNTSPEDAITAIGAALRGENEPIRRFGVLLDDATLKARAMAMGLYDGTGSLNAQQKTLAAYSEILAQSTDAQGDFERTQDGLANKSRTLTANLQDLSATVGQQLTPTVNDYVSAGLKLIDQVQGTGDQTDSTTGALLRFSTRMTGLLTPIGQVISGLGTVNSLVGKYADEAEDAKTATERWADAMIKLERGDLRRQTEAARAARRRDYLEQQRLEEARKKAAEDRERAEKAAAEAATRRAAEAKRRAEQEKQALKDLAAATNEALIDAANAAFEQMKSLRTESQAYSDGLRDQVSGYVSLSDAVRAAGESDDKVNDALRERRDAYAELNALQEERRRRGFDVSDPGIAYDADQYAAALRRVADAEAGVTQAQGQRVDYAAVFRQQIADARAFADNLKALSVAGLGVAGIQQLLSVGPTAGNAIAKELLSGVGSLTIGGLNADLAALAQAGSAFGGQVAGGVFGAQIDQAGTDALALAFGARAATVNNTVTIQVSGGDPQAVVDALTRWYRQNGALPVAVSF